MYQYGNTTYELMTISRLDFLHLRSEKSFYHSLGMSGPLRISYSSSVQKLDKSAARHTVRKRSGVAGIGHASQAYYLICSSVASHQQSFLHRRLYLTAHPALHTGKRSLHVLFMVVFALLSSSFTFRCTKDLPCNHSPVLLGMGNGMAKIVIR